MSAHPTSEAPLSAAETSGSGDPASASLLASLTNLGPVAQAVLPGLYAWGVTVSPLAWSRGSPVVAKIGAVCGLVALVGAPFAERRSPPLARVLSVWGFAMASAIVWLSVPAAQSRLEPARAFAGFIGWALFAFASAAPAPSRDPEAADRLIAGAALRPRGRIATGDRVILGAAFLVGAAYQTIGWNIAVAERALLVRLVAIATALAILGGATHLALSRHSPSTSSARARLRAAAPQLIGLAFVLFAGLAMRILR